MCSEPFSIPNEAIWSQLDGLDVHKEPLSGLVLEDKLRHVWSHPGVVTRLTGHHARAGLGELAAIP